MKTEVILWHSKEPIPSIYSEPYQSIRGPSLKIHFHIYSHKSYKLEIIARIHVTAEVKVA
jgi:hypothetical protein